VGADYFEGRCKFMMVKGNILTELQTINKAIEQVGKNWNSETRSPVPVERKQEL